MAHSAFDSSKNWIWSPSLRVTIAFFQFWSFRSRGPCARSLPRIDQGVDVDDRHLEQLLDASLIWILFASCATSKMTWFSPRGAGSTSR